ncbi:DegT/DnrJ/EryC1/StrS family aminotransferase [Chryseobacterium indologenes]|uniref:DegT/DnrJ/EryC1/StrS family aminotransferase n=1 Tax=Chryseobacterium indologenes TaxID=253 RepID=UPI001109BCF1|nr:DegT/DnrJ/EryC1/StrS family aminotransferase [Chryseobacterium indologenes]TLX27217.1 DegT/DnrJ/EryC1/StrS family aminotransferase [Chryseobacterium indologenes]
MIKFLDLQKINMNHQQEIEEALLQTFRSGWYLLGEKVKKFEEQLSSYCNVPYAIGVANGLDALRLIFRAYIELGIMQEGDEILVPANTYIASILALTDNKLVPVLVEPDINTYNVDLAKLEEKITPKTKAILLVHLYGSIVFSEDLQALSEKYNLKIVEDNAQAIGASWKDRKSGGLGDAAGFSFYPGKNLGAIGDSGAITCKDKNLSDCIRALANYGSQVKYVNQYQGYNSRMDEIQAAVLSVKFNYLDIENSKRKEIANRYLSEITHPKISLPHHKLDEHSHVYHVFVIRSEKRDQLQQYLTDNGIQTLIHYPIPPHHQEAYSEWKDLQLPITEKIHKEVLSIPISPVMTEEEVTKVIETLNAFDQ